jgi:hypothetical protein
MQQEHQQQSVSRIKMRFLPNTGNILFPYSNFFSQVETLSKQAINSLLKHKRYLSSKSQARVIQEWDVQDGGSGRDVWKCFVDCIY